MQQSKYPKRASDISRDVMKLVSPLLRVTYGISVSYDTWDDSIKPGQDNNRYYAATYKANKQN